MRGTKKIEMEQDDRIIQENNSNMQTSQFNGILLGRRSIILSIVLLSLAMVILGGLAINNIISISSSSERNVATDVLFCALYVFMPVGVILAILALAFQVKSQKQMKETGELTSHQKKIQKIGWVLIGAWAIPIVLACVMPLLFAIFALIVGLHDWL